MTNTVETSEELVARARELCETINELALDEEDDWEINLRSNPDNQYWKDKLAIATGTHRLAITHLAEMDEHNKRTVDYRGNDYSCEVCGGLTNPCRGLVTKVKRLLGVE